MYQKDFLKIVINNMFKYEALEFKMCPLITKLAYLIKKRKIDRKQRPFAA